MKKKWFLIIVTITALVFTGGIIACKHGHHPCSFDEFDLSAATNRIASRLDLTEPQKVDLEQMAKEITDKAKAMHAGHENRRQEVAEMIRQESIDQAVVDALVAERLEKMKEMVDFASKRLIAFHRTLTPEQREKVAVRIEDHGANGCRFGFR